LQVWHPVLTFLPNLLVFLDGLVAGPVRLVKTILLVEDAEESSSPGNTDDNVGCMIVHDGFAMTSKKAREVEQQMGRRKHINVSDQC